ncbi:MAG: FAD-dependent monooxygenase [Chloroflexia bacterium]
MTKPARIGILGGGPAGLYCGLLLKKSDPSRDVTILERNPADVTYGWGVVFSDRTLDSFQRADPRTYEQITCRFVIWDAIDVRYRGETVRCGGHVIAAIARGELLGILQRRCAELGVKLCFGTEVTDTSELAEYDLLIAADGINSLVRREHEDLFGPQIALGKAHYIWLGADRALDAFTFIFRETPYGLFQVHAYPFSGTTSTFIVECADSTWRAAGLDRADEAASLDFCQKLLRADLGGVALQSNNSKWIQFPTLTTKTWHTAIRRPIVLLGDAAHTAHFSIGSGTKLAMEDAIALAAALDSQPSVEAALDAYEVERRPVVELFQRAATESQSYFETLDRYLGLPPIPFAFQLLTRSGRISYDDLRLRDPGFGASVDRWYNWNAECGVRSAEWTAGENKVGQSARNLHSAIIAPPPVFAPLYLREVTLPNRVATVMRPIGPACDGMPPEDWETEFAERAAGGAGLVVTPIVSVSPEGRITPDDAGIWAEEQAAAWGRIVAAAHGAGQARMMLRLGHAGRRGATRPRSGGLDRPLLAGGWPLVAPSALPYTPQSRVPQALDRAGMDMVRDAFVRAAELADAAGFDILQLHCAHGYLLAGFLSPLTNRRDDEYGGGLENRMRFPLEVVGAVRAAWTSGKPLAVALSATDGVRGGGTVEDAITVARALRDARSDLIIVQAGQTTPEGTAPYGLGYLTPLSARIRNGADVPTLVSGYLTTANEVNTVLAAGRADHCLMEER